ncbi:GPH family glycoside/pentoside/hexuronide:cation symporter [Dysgonomonas sp. PFB1-18]|uniref:MFS transporter n=1 Tax=unclassified Dysgonomonas TaxID=2630389 RepID=UPI0024748C88|nr:MULTISPECIES: MFS transporter [unclassified Dysgonomonas]MDL2303064.1 MFS transporter [Dysgonomonas sp. OttesenSCG-928-D17]MDH6310126.1 GPH family glycoside/pentoside/hexuronide:cation symporter [Dysgonomonas sp. PF1-14]MDH6340208.1 GPH family glycoside/pentoside/hexuronide:cation symporter [Dysgonomonas sp. PF1-16]MDH6381683.1 GPH family glycoside/pentoside/hexuronide:cation symporter [Dysgonomonas sp. PFB1-18]MDH6399042.1 GPH family glycoside/pentoside/hexuronide:cation symporter [Dysgono
MESTLNVNTESKGFYKLSWLQRIGFGSGDLAQNLIYQTVAQYLLIFYTNVFGLPAATAAIMFLIVRLVDVVWDPLVGAFVDKHNPKLGKYRSYLVLGGIPLTGFAILCFWNGFSGSLVYAYITYVGLSMCYTLINVPYGALNASLTRDTDEITKLTSTRMFLANLGGLAVAYGIPIIVKSLSPDGKINSPEAGNAWFITMTIYALSGLALLIFCYTQTKERVVMDEKDTSAVKVSDLWMEFKHNRPLRILAFFFITAFAMMAIGNSAGSYYMIYNVQAPDWLPYFAALGSIPAFIFMPMVPAIKKAIGKKQMFYVFLTIAILGMAMLYVISVVPALKTQVWLVLVAQFVKSTGVIVATGYMWALVPEVISYGEHTTGKRISGIVNALTGIFFKAGMALGGVVPGFVLAFVDFDEKNAVTQSAFAQQGILWLVAVIPAILLLLAMFIISKYELEDDVIDKINREIEERHLNK